MLQITPLDKINKISHTGRLQIVGTSRIFSEQKQSIQSDNNKYRMTQKILRSNLSKKMKSQVSPDEIRQNKVGSYENKNLRRSITHRINQPSNQNQASNIHSNFKIRFQNTGRMAALSNHSPQKIKIKTSGLVNINDTIPTSVQKQVPGPKQIKTKYSMTRYRKYSLSNQLKNKGENKNQEQKINEKIQFTPFQSQEIKKFHVYYKGNRRINSKTDFTDLQGNSLIQIGDSIAYRYQVLEQLGKGAFGKVYRCVDHKKNQQVALKIIRSLPKLNKQAKIEIQILEKAISHDPELNNNIVRMKGSFVFRSHSCITYEILSKNLYQYLKMNKFNSTPNQILVKFAIQILHALNFLQKNKIVHCDIKPENIMLRQAHKTGLRLIDFGSSCVQSEQFYTYIQSRYYRAPEVILGIRYTTAIDMWSFGCVLAELYTGYPLFPGQNQQEQLLMFIQLLGYPPDSMLQIGTRRKRFFNQSFQPRIPQSPDKYRVPKGTTIQKLLQNCSNKQFVQFMKRCMVWDPSKRITPKQALLHDWILEGIPINIRPRHIKQVTGEEDNFL